jgi:hypothetical protein
LLAISALLFCVVSSIVDAVRNVEEGPAGSGEVAVLSRSFSSSCGPVTTGATFGLFGTETRGGAANVLGAGELS